MPLKTDPRLVNLERANRIRTYRSEVKRNLRAGAKICPMVADPPAELATMRVDALLAALPRWTLRVRVWPLLRRLRIPEHQTIGGMTGRQREDLLAALTEAGFC